MTYQADLGRVKGIDPRRKERFAEFQNYLSGDEPGLRIEFDHAARRARIVGDMEMRIGAGVPRTYRLEIRFNDLNPFSAPEVWDRGHHFEPDGQRHVEDHGQQGWRWCLWLAAVPEVDFEQEDPLTPFLSKVRGFIKKQLIYEDRRRRGHPKPWPGPEWGHGNAGYVEWFDEVLGNIDLGAMKRLLPFMKGARLSARKTCPCGSGQKAGDCHRSAAEKIRTSLTAAEVDRVVSEWATKRGKSDVRSTA